MGKKYCITGGAGYLGYHVGRALLKRRDGLQDPAPNTVVLFDRSIPTELWKDSDQPDALCGFTFVQGNVLNIQDLESAFAGCDCVIHTAAFGLSNRDQLSAFWKEVEDINLGGTNNVIQACCRQNVPSLVYTSTNNVVFHGQEILDGDESLPYTPTFKHSDNYSRTKRIAEQMVLLVDGKCLSDGQGHLRTCALRLGGIMGPGEQRHILRTMSCFRSGIVVAKFSYNEGLQDFVLIHNAVDAHILAAKALMDANRRITVGGQPYFISDGLPVNAFEYFSKIAEGLGYRTPKLRIPAVIVWILVVLLEMIPSRLFVALDIAILTRTEFLKMVTSHYFNIDKARRELGYCPTRPNDTSEVIEWLKQRTNRLSSSSACEPFFRSQNAWLKFLSVFLLLIAFLVIFLLF